MIGRGGVVSTSVGVGFATGLYGISFGALATAAGLSFWQAMALSLLMFSGGSQFAIIGVLGTSGVAGAVPAVISAWLLGVRNGFYALRLNSVLHISGVTKLLAAQLTIDESNAVSAAQDQERERRIGFWLTGAAVFVFWNLCTGLGAVLGQSVGDPRNWGLDAAAAAAFLGLIWPRLQASGQARLVAAIAALLALGMTPVLPSGVPVVAASLLAVLLGNFIVRLRGRRG